MENNGELKVVFVDELHTDFEVKAAVFKPEQILKKNEKGKKYNRAKKKEELYDMTKDIVER